MNVCENTEEYLSLKELCAQIPYKEQTIRNLVSQGALREGIHYFKPHGRLRDYRRRTGSRPLLSALLGSDHDGTALDSSLEAPELDCPPLLPVEARVGHREVPGP